QTVFFELFRQFHGGSKFFGLFTFHVPPTAPLKIQLVEGHAGIGPLLRIRHNNTAIIGYHLTAGLDFDSFRSAPSDTFSRHDANHAADQLVNDQKMFDNLGIHTPDKV